MTGKPLNPKSQNMLFGGDAEILAQWARGPNFLIVNPDGLRCQCGGVVEHCGDAGGCELFHCGACGSRGNMLADRVIKRAPAPPPPKPTTVSKSGFPWPFRRH